MRKAVLLLLAVATVLAVSFTTTPVINDDADAITTDNLTCEWSSSADTTETNVTWYRDGAVFTNITNTSSPSIIQSENTSRYETWNCSVRISNGTDTTVETDSINVTNADPLSVNVYNESDQAIGENTTLDEDTTRTFNATTTDPDGDELTYGYVSPPGIPDNSDLTFDTGVFTWTPNQSQVGTHNITFTAEDNQSPKGFTATSKIFIVNEVNDKPIFSPELENQSAKEDESFVYNISTQDEENDTPINFTLSSDLSDLQIQNKSGSTANITFTDGSPDFEDRGNNTVNVTIEDSRNATRTDSFILQVNATNQRPNLSTIPNASTTQDEVLNVTFNATDRNTNDTLSFDIYATNCSTTDPWSVSKLNQTDRSNNTVAYGRIAENISNDHIACPTVNVTVNDTKETDVQTVTFNLTNVNDPPTVQEISNSASNTDGKNISNQTGYLNAKYTYVVNATDPDTVIPDTENLSYADNATLFNISNTGTIQFTPTNISADTYSFNITVSDGEINDSATLNLTVENNSVPNITDPGNVTCPEDIRCQRFINGTDADGNNITYTSNTSIFNITNYNTTTGVVNRTYNQSFVGSYNVTVNGTDIRGAVDTVDFTFTVNNTNDPPVLDTIPLPTPIVTNRSYLFNVTSTDEDIALLGGEERVNYSATFINSTRLFNISTTFNNATNTTTGVVNFTVTSNETGNYTVNITGKDRDNATDTVQKNFTVYPDSDPPNITQISPYGRPVSNNTVFAFINTSSFDGNTSINLTENTTVLFNYSATDDTTATENLTSTWYVNGTNVTTNRSFNRTFDFFSSGRYNVTVVVEDTRREDTRFDWTTDVANVNREPVLKNDLPNVTDLTQSTTFSAYFYQGSGGEIRYIDPDDDRDDDDEIGANETNKLSFTYEECSVANITVDGTDATFSPEEVGECRINFTATDPEGAKRESNTVLINVSDVPNGTTSETTTVVSSSGGGGGGGSASTIIPQEVDNPIPDPLNLIAPQQVTIYKNNTITVPIRLRNTYNDSIEDVELDASSNTSANMSFQQDSFAEIPQGEVEETTMTVTGYRLGENFEVLVNATVGTPEFSDSALILFNSIEETSEGPQTEMLVTFARDLLQQNEECRELQTVLEEAQQTEDNAEKEELLNTVIQGCQYLIEETQVQEEQPTSVSLDFIERFRWFYAGIGVLLLALIGSVVWIEMQIRSGE